MFSITVGAKSKEKSKTVIYQGGWSTTVIRVITGHPGGMVYLFFLFLSSCDSRKHWKWPGGWSTEHPFAEAFETLCFDEIPPKAK